MIFKRTLLATLVTLFFVTAMKAQNSDVSELEQEIEKLFAKWNSVEHPGVVVGIINNGDFIYKNAFGAANLELSIPLTTDHKFRIASTSKQFTAACIFLLEKQGKLQLEDNITKYLLDFPDYGVPIKIKHLVSHSSGIRDYTLLHYLMGYDDDYLFTETSLYNLIKKQSQLDFKPNTSFSYSNSGYFLLSLIVEKITGSSLREYASNNLFKPLKMDATLFLDNHNEVIKNRTFGYDFNKKHYELLLSQNDIVGDGGVFTTLNDLKKWDDNFYSGNVGGDNFLNAMTTPMKLGNDIKNNYAGGLYIRNYKGLSTQSHSGFFGGYKSIIMRFPNQHTSIIILTNNNSISPMRIAPKIANILFKDIIVNKEKKRKKRIPKEYINIENQMVSNSFVGSYYCDEISSTYRFERQGKLLKVRVNDLKEFSITMSGEKFYIDEMFLVSISKKEKNKVNEFKLEISPNKFLLFKRLGNITSGF